MAKIKRRNPVAHTAILRKGGVHEKTRSAHRQKQKREMQKAVSDYACDKKFGSKVTWTRSKKGGEQSIFVVMAMAA